MSQTLIQIGNSLGVTIPSKLVKQLGLRSGQNVIVTHDLEAGTMQISFPDRSQLSLLSSKSKR